MELSFPVLPELGGTLGLSSQPVNLQNPPIARRAAQTVFTTPCVRGLWLTKNNQPLEARATKQLNAKTENPVRAFSS
jgi:hypothetical protein